MNADDADATASASSAATSVFNLYQEGLAPDHVLQLCFVRQRGAPPHPLRPNGTRVAQAFDLPRPALPVASLLPPVDVSLDHFVDRSSLLPLPKDSTDATAAALPATALDRAQVSARTHLFDPRQAAPDDVRQWAALTKSDWLTVYQSLQPRDLTLDQEDARTGLGAAQAPDPVDVCWMLEHCRSDAFAAFVWDHLLLSLLQQCREASDHLTLQRLCALLVRHHSLASLSPRDFRANVRSRNLRQVDELVGAQAELALIGYYRRQRAQAGARFP